jgi:hypothetical protein
MNNPPPNDYWETKYNESHAERDATHRKHVIATASKEELLEGLRENPLGEVYVEKKWTLEDGNGNALLSTPSLRTKDLKYLGAGLGVGLAVAWGPVLVRKVQAKWFM